MTRNNIPVLKPRENKVDPILKILEPTNMVVELLVLRKSSCGKIEEES